VISGRRHSWLQAAAWANRPRSSTPLATTTETPSPPSCLERWRTSWCGFESGGEGCLQGLTPMAAKPIRKERGARHRSRPAAHATVRAGPRRGPRATQKHRRREGARATEKADWREDNEGRRPLVRSAQSELMTRAFQSLVGRPWTAQPAVRNLLGARRR